jgi:hypothetical protein
MLSGGIQTHDLSRRAVADLRLRPRDHWECFTKYILYTLVQALRLCRGRTAQWGSRGIAILYRH